MSITIEWLEDCRLVQFIFHLFSEIKNNATHYARQ